uniref:Uncharacterized protein n=1 Tax=Arundo donax TaxID=35708 RepID=A0A0A9GKD9_ARUDO
MSSIARSCVARLYLPFFHHGTPRCTAQSTAQTTWICAAIVLAKCQAYRWPCTTRHMKKGGRRCVVAHGPDSKAHHTTN